MEKSEKIILILLLIIFVFLICVLGFIKIGKKFKGGYVYFVKSDTEDTYLVKVERKLPLGSSVEKKIEVLIENLLIGPTEKEERIGISTTLPEGVKLHKVERNGDTVYIDFSEEIEQGGGTSLMETRLAQIVFTATQFPDVKKVKLLIDGKEIEYFSSEGIMVDKPLTRDDFVEFIKEEEENERKNTSQI